MLPRTVIGPLRYRNSIHAAQTVVPLGIWDSGIPAVCLLATIPVTLPLVWTPTAAQGNHRRSIMSVRRLYETTYIINAALEDAEIDAVAARVNAFLEENGSTLVEVNKMGRRRLAYPIKKKYNGFYVYAAFEAPAATLPMLEKFFFLEDAVIRHLSLQLDPKLREFRKVRAEAQALRAAQMAEAAKTGSPIH